MDSFYPHKSHSRNDLIKIITLFKLPIEDVHDYNKKELINKLINVLDEVESIEPDNTYYNVKDLNELKQYLIKPNQKKCLSVKDKQEVMTTCKLIINYCRNGYCLELSYFDNIDTIYQEARRISQWGDIPTCRRMCKLLNENPHRNEKVYPVISNAVKKQLESRNISDKKILNPITFKTGTFVLTF